MSGKICRASASKIAPVLMMFGSSVNALKTEGWGGSTSSVVGQEAIGAVEVANDFRALQGAVCGTSTALEQHQQLAGQASEGYGPDDTCQPEQGGLRIRRVAGEIAADGSDGHGTCQYQYLPGRRESATSPLPGQPQHDTARQGAQGANGDQVQGWHY